VYSNRNRCSGLVFAVVLAVLIAVLQTAQPVLGQNVTWSGGGGTDWNTVLNWSPLTVPNSASAVANFTGNATGIVNISASITAQTLNFTNPGGGSGYVITTSSASQTLSGLTTINIGAGVNAGSTIGLTSVSTGNLLFPAGSNLTINDNAINQVNTAFVIGPTTVIGTPGTGGVIVNGSGITQITGSFATSPNNVIGGLTKNGPGFLEFNGSGANLSGGLTLNGGTLALDYSNNTASKINGGPLTLDGGLLLMTANSGTPVAQTIPAGTIVAAGQTSVQGAGTGTLTLNAAAITHGVGGTVDFVLNSPGSTFSVQTSTGNTNGLLGTGPAFATVNNGAGWATLSGVVVAPLAGYSINTYTSGANTDVTASTAQSNITTNSLRFNVPNLSLSLSGTNILQSGGILGTPSGGGEQITGVTATLAAVGGGELFIHQYSNGPLTIGAALVSSAGLTKSGSGPLVLSGNNTGLTGPININRGSLTVSGTTAPVNSASAINFNDDRVGTGLQTFTVALPSNNSGTITPPIRLSAFATNFGTTFTTGSGISNTTITLSGVISSTPGLTTPIQITGDASDTSGFNLTNTNTFTGSVDLLHGSLGINSNASLGNAANPLILEVTDTNNGGLVFLNSGVNLARPITSGTATRIISNGADVNTISGAITGSGILIKTGTGTLILSGTNNYGTAGVNSAAVNGGTLTVSGGGSLTTAGNIGVGNSGNAGQSGAMTVDGVSSVTQTGNAFVQVGSFALSSGSLNIGTTASGASFTIGTGGLGINGAASSVTVGNGAVTGTLTANGSVFVNNGGTLQVGNGSNFILGIGQQLVVSSGQANFTGSYDTSPLSTYTVSGVGDKLTYTGLFRVTNGGTASVTSGGLLSTASIDVGTNTGNGILTVDGAGSSAVATTSASNWGLSGYTANVIFSNGATGSFVHGLSLSDSQFSSVANLIVKSGAQLTIGAFDICQGVAGFSGTPSATVTVSDLGSFITASGPVNIGDNNSGDAGVLNVQNNATFTSATTSLFPTGTININGGTANLGALSFQGGAINFNSGALSFNGNLSVGPTAGILGADLNLASNRILTVGSITTVDQFHTLTLGGGTLNTAALTVNGTFAFNSGTLGVTGANGLTIGTGGALGASFSLGAGRTMNVTNATTIASDGVLFMSGGMLNATGGISNNGEIQLLDPTSQLAGAAITNHKLIDGTGRISNNLVNSNSGNTIGEVRASGSQHLTFTGTSNTNSGKIDLLQGGTIEFTGPLSNTASGLITGRGALMASSISNAGAMTFSAGFTDVFGAVTNVSGAKVTVTGGGTATFYDPFALPSGASVQTSASSTVVFLSAVSGTGSFTGLGLKIFEAGGGPPSVLGSLDSVVGSTRVEAAAVVTANSFNENTVSLAGALLLDATGAASQTNSITIDPGGLLDVNNNQVIVSYSGASPASLIRSYLVTGFDNGNWDGQGIDSSAAHNDATFRTALGYLDNGSNVTIKYTYYGDSNLDGVVNTTDFQMFLDGLVAASGSSWSSGDYTYDGKVDLGNDFNLFLRGYLSQGNSLGELGPVVMADSALSQGQKAQLMALVPEPPAAGIAVLGAFCAGNLRRRKSVAE
jgi:fibronectin-binding autotransporter adhesin